nr:NAD-dependent epimerase/dehydratase family protein [uncultured Cupriavidus sp.]
MKIVLPGGAGLVGQNLVVRLKQQGITNLVVLDKHRKNLEVMRRLHPDLVIEYADLAEPGDWESHFKSADAVVMLQAQIGAKELEPFTRNNIDSTKQILRVIKSNQTPYTVHISSSVVNSVAKDYYTDTKREQEEIVIASAIPGIVLRPTLMFGWFDRKHLGWLARFMKSVPVFPIPGHGRYMRQPLYVGDFSNIIVSCLKRRQTGGVYNISGLERVNYIDIIRTIRKVTGANTRIMRIPYGLFAVLLRIWAVFDKNPPFTADQLKALTAGDEFEVIDWPGIFGVQPTRFEQAVNETFTDPVYGAVELEF